MVRKIFEPLILTVSLVAAAFYGGWEAALGVSIVFVLCRLGLLFSV